MVCLWKIYVFVLPKSLCILQLIFSWKQEFVWLVHKVPNHETALNHSKHIFHARMAFQVKRAALIWAMWKASQFANIWATHEYTIYEYNLKEVDCTYVHLKRCIWDSHTSPQDVLDINEDASSVWLPERVCGHDVHYKFAENRLKSCFVRKISCWDFSKNKSAMIHNNFFMFIFYFSNTTNLIKQQSSC